MRPAGFLACAVFLASGAWAAESAQAPAAVVHVEGSGEAVDWKVATSLPPGALYHVLWEGPQKRHLISIVRLPPRYHATLHAHKFNQVLVVVRGGLKVSWGTTTRWLRRGDYAVFPQGIAHDISVGWRGAEVVMQLDAPPPGEFKNEEGLFGG